MSERPASQHRSRFGRVDGDSASADLESTLVRLRGALSRSSVRRVLSRSAAVFGLLLSLQAIPSVTGSADYVSAVWLTAESIVTLVVLLLIVVATVVQRFVRTTMLLFAGLYLAAFVAWPLGVTDIDAAQGTQPWLWGLIAVAMGFAVIALPVFWACVYIVVVTSVYVIVHALPAGGSAELKGSMLDAVYVLLIGAFMVMLAVTLNRAADRVDAAQATAMQQYGRAVGNQAMEAERTRMDALVHDSVLSTLITAARAESDLERAAAVRSAISALETLQAAPDAFDPDSDVTLDEFAARLKDAVHLLSPRAAFATERLETTGPAATGLATLPGRVADALFSAAVQAFINSLQHAGDDTTVAVLRTVSVHRSLDQGGEVTVQVSDTGVGFDPSAVPRERLGLRVSIRQRVESVGGEAVVRSMPGGGASVVLTWRSPSAADDADAQQKHGSPVTAGSERSLS